MKKINLVNWLIIIGISLFSIVYLFFGKPEQGLYKTLIIISIIPVMLIPFILNKCFKLNISSKIEFVYLVFIFLAYLLGTILNFFGKISIYDKLIHALSGFITSILAVLLLVKSKANNKNPLFINILFIISVILSVALLWECFEFICDNLFNKDAQKVLTTGVNDTMIDMIMAFTGSIIFSFIYIFEDKTNKKI